MDPTKCIGPRPEVTAEASEILDLLRLCSSQLRPTFGGVVGVDWNVVEKRAAERGIDTTCSWWGVLGWWEVFHIAENEWASIMNKPAPKEESAG